jgi:hypothetical protein
VGKRLQDQQAVVHFYVNCWSFPSEHWENPRRTEIASKMTRQCEAHQRDSFRRP